MSPLESLQRALRFADAFNWAAAAAPFAVAESGLLKAGDSTNALYARLGSLRATAEQQQRPLPLIADEIEMELATNPILRNNPEMRMFALAAKGDINGESNTSAMRRDWEAVEALAKQLGDKRMENRSRIFLGLASYYDGDVNTARLQVTTALNAAKILDDKPAQVVCLLMVAKGYGDIGMAPQALQIADSAFVLAATIPDAGYQYFGKGIKQGILLKLNRPAEAEALAYEMVDRARADNRVVQQVTALANLAAALRVSNNLSRSRSVLEESLQLTRRFNLVRLEGVIESELLETLQKSGQLELAEEHARGAAEATQKAGDLIFASMMLGRLGQIQLARGNSDAALDSFEKAESLIDASYGRTLNTFDRSTLARTAGDTYTSHFSLLAIRQAAPAQLFGLIERIKARTLTDLLSSGSSSMDDVLPDAGRELAKLRLDLMGARANDEAQKIVRDIRSAEQRLWMALGLDLRSSLRSDLTIAEFQKRLPLGTVVLEYVLADPASYCLVVTNAGAKVIRLSSREEIGRNIQALAKGIAAKEHPTTVARQLFGQLVAPALGATRATTIVVIRDGALHQIPFEALQDSQGRYLGLTAAIFYSPSATALVGLTYKKDPRKSNPTKLLAVGGVPYARAGVNRKGILGGYSSKPFTDLPGSLEEVQSVASALPAAARKVLSGEAATEAALKKAGLSQYSHLHFAVHGVANTMSPDRAALIMLSDAVAGEDGFLESSEIARLALTAEVVTLSACNTSVGIQQGQEGVENLSRAFLMAGARSVVSTLWPVEDEAAAFLMKRFYGHLALKKPPAIALAEAKRELLRTFGSRATPHLWAGFILEGGL